METTTKPQSLTIAAAIKLANEHGFRSLITEPRGNAKLAKSEGWYNCGITLAQGNLSGHEVCHGRGNCFTFEGQPVCLGNWGQAEGLSMLGEIRVNRTKCLFENREAFDQIIMTECERVDRLADRLGLPVAFRPNILSDYPWHQTHAWLFESFPHWQFYGYTKIRSVYRQFLRGELPANYHLTMSYNERLTDEFCCEILSAGGTLAVPFAVKRLDELPSRFLGFDVVDGVSSDLRFLDAPGSVVGLVAKSPKATADKIRFLDLVKRSGFMVDPVSDTRCN